jgi:hypothetical protein
LILAIEGAAAGEVLDVNANEGALSWAAGEIRRLVSEAQATIQTLPTG